MRNPYEDLLHLPHHVSPTRPPMPMKDRAAQFSPFAALVGYDAAIRETGRRTDRKIELEGEGLERLNRQLLCLMEEPEQEVTFTCFRRDERKEGGTYLDIRGQVKKVDEVQRMIFLRDGTALFMDDVLDIRGERFREPEL